MNHIDLIFKSKAIEFAEKQLDKTKLVQYGNKLVLTDTKYVFCEVKSYPETFDDFYIIRFMNEEDSSLHEEFVSFNEVMRFVISELSLKMVLN